MTFSQLKKIKNDQLKIGTKNKGVLKTTDIFICSGNGCDSCGGIELINKLKTLLKNTNINIHSAGCFGLCAEGPIVFIEPSKIMYVKVYSKDANKLANSILSNTVLEDFLPKNSDGSVSKTIDDLKFFHDQKFVVLNHMKEIDAGRIEDYIKFDGYFALYKALSSMTPLEVINEISNSGIRGRGGAGFPTGKKWGFAAAENNPIKYIICNGDEGDPGAFMDRSVMESNPHSIIEGMAIAGYAIGAHEGVIYCRAEYALASSRLQKAIDDAKNFGILGKNIFGLNFDFNIKIVLGMGAFVCGEETALIESVEGKRGEPRIKPPYPASCGLWNKPTVINNVETLANVAQIILNGAKWYSSMGTENSKGTKVFALSGKVNNAGLVELPMGATIRDIIFKIGGGIPNGKKFKAVQLGGPSGACVPESLIDVPIDYDSLAKNELMMGSGGMVVTDEDTCMVDFAKFFLEFTVSESCGKCVPCRIGNKRLLELLQKITTGKASMKDLDELEKLCIHVKQTSLCGLGQSSPNPVLSTLKHFKNEYVEHIINKRCPAKVCKELIKFDITNKCIGCGLCKRQCPVSAISGNPKMCHKIDEKTCIRCGLCESTCPVKAIRRADKYGNN